MTGHAAAIAELQTLAGNAEAQAESAWKQIVELEKRQLDLREHMVEHRRRAKDYRVAAEALAHPLNVGEAGDSDTCAATERSAGNPEAYLRPVPGQRT